MTPSILFTNFARSTLASSLTNVATTLTVATSHGARFPSPTGGQYFYVVLEDASLNREIVRVTARAGDSMTIVRGVDNTTARAWNAGDIVSHRIVSAAITDVLNAAGNQIVHVDNYGAVGGATDDTAAFQAALTAVGNAGGGTVQFSRNHRILGNLTVPLNTTLSGPLHAPGQMQPGDALADYENLAGVLRVASSVTITTLASAGVVNAIILRDGLTLPFADQTAAATGIAAFAGTPLTAGGADGRWENLLILGFARAIDSLNHSRGRYINVQGDCTNGIRVQNSTDITRMSKCHFWPFTTANFTWTASDASKAILRRSGIAYELANITDWAHLTDCFSYGYFRGFRFASVSSVTASACAADETINAGVTLHTGSIGFLIEGTCVDIKLIGTTVAGKATGYWMASSTAGASAELVSCDGVACSSGVYIASGNVRFEGGLLRACGYGLDINSTTSRVYGTPPRIQDSLTSPIRFQVVNNLVELLRLDLPSSANGAAVVASGTNWQIPGIASADPLNLPINGDKFLVTGTTGFGTLAGGYRGREVTLLFNGALNVVNGGSMRLSAGANFTTTNGATLTLFHNGTQWYEKSRSA